MVEPQKLRTVLIGASALVFNMHRLALTQPFVDLVGLCDINPEPGQTRAAELGVPFYSDYRQMLSELRPTVTVIATPHYLHPQMAIDAMRMGSHVLTEKPMATQVADADRMVQTARETGKLLAVNFQQRLRPEIVAAKRLVDAGQLGTFQRVSLMVPWPRSYRYYSLATWRATWWGEGGGVLLNQAPHDLDLICHLAGSPRRVISWNRTNFQQIEVEDTISAMLEWANGATGYLHISTAESGPKSSLELVGTKGSLQIGEGALTFNEFDQDVHDFLRATDKIYEGPGQHPVPVEVSTEGGRFEGNHPSVYRNFFEAIMTGSPISANGAEGVKSLELANAMIYSSYTQSAVELPLDRDRYSALLADLIAKSPHRPL